MQERTVEFQVWLERCLGRAVVLRSWRELSGKSGGETWECRIETDERRQSVVLKVLRPGFDDYSGLGPTDTVKKHLLALRELPRFGVPAPRALGSASRGPAAALLVEMVDGLPWRPETRVEAARVLARLHNLGIERLSHELADCVRRSTPNRFRILRGVEGSVRRLDEASSRWRHQSPELADLASRVIETGEPSAEEPTLVHGDYFSVNVLAVDDGVCVIDWDLLSLGDPMWDLGFLIGADRNVSREAGREVVRAYGAIRPPDLGVLQWHTDCWEAFWGLRDLVQETG